MLAEDPAVLKEEGEARTTHGWAVALVEARFREGLAKVFDGAFIATRFEEFVSRSDPIYVTLLQGMGDESAARALVGHWMVAHTLATQTRFWLEDAIVDFLLNRPPSEPDEPRPAVYSFQMLAANWHITGRSLWDLGEKWREELHGRGAWRPLIQERALDEIERIVGEEERRFEAAIHGSRGFPHRNRAISKQEDEQSLMRAAGALGAAARPISVRCNLLIIEPDAPGREPHVWAIRYINPTTFGSAAAVKAERINLLRLRAWLAQEKPFRAPRHIVVAIGDIVPRLDREDAGGRIASHFSPLTRWTSDRFWQFLRVPFAAVTAGIRDAGVGMREQLASGLDALRSREKGADRPSG